MAEKQRRLQGTLIANSWNGVKGRRELKTLQERYYRAFGLIKG